MYITSERYKEILDSDEQRYGSYIELENGTKITSKDDLSGLKITDTIGSNLVGSFSPKIANISILNNHNYDLTDKRFKLFVGLYLNDDDIEYIPYGTFIVSKPTENDKATKEITLEAKDLSYLFDKEYERTKFEDTFPCTLLEWTQAICNEIGVPLANTDFPNNNSKLEYQPYTEDGATYRNVISKISEASASFAKVGRDDKLYFRQLNSIGTKKRLTVEQVHKMTVKDLNSSLILQLNTEVEKQISLKSLFEQSKDDLKYGPINSIVASRIVADDGSTTEDIYIKDEESINENGLCEYKIKENWIIDDDREEYIKNILDSMGGTTFNTGKIELTSDPSIDVGDYIEVSDVESDTSFIMLVMDNELDATTYTNVIQSSMPSKTQTDYNSATMTKKDKIRRTELKVNKLDGKITSVIEEQSEFSNKLTQVEQTVDSISQKVSDIEDVTNTEEGNTTITLENCVEGDLLELHIYGNNTVFQYLYPSDTLYPDNDLYPYGDSRIVVKYEDGTSEIYELGVLDVLRQNGTTTDEYVLEKGQAKVIRKISKDGSILANEMIEDLGKYSIKLKEGINTITIQNYTAKLSAKFAIKNDYTDIFATKVEMNSTISQTAEEINSQVSKKVGEDEIISKINQSAEAVGINANKIELSANDILNLLAGNTINLTSKNIVISSNNFNIDKNGNMSCENANISGKVKVGGDEENPEFIATDGENYTYIYPLGLLQEYSNSGGYAAIQKGRIRCRNIYRYIYD